jgi:hypothetical protein
MKNFRHSNVREIILFICYSTIAVSDLYHSDYEAGAIITLRSWLKTLPTMQQCIVEGIATNDFDTKRFLMD